PGRFGEWGPVSEVAYRSLFYAFGLRGRNRPSAQATAGPPTSSAPNAAAKLGISHSSSKRSSRALDGATGSYSTVTLSPMLKPFPGNSSLGRISWGEPLGVM